MVHWLGESLESLTYFRHQTGVVFESIEKETRMMVTSQLSEKESEAMKKFSKSRMSNDSHFMTLFSHL